MRPWRARPPEIANLLNPAFVARLAREIAAGAKEGGRTGVPYSILFLAIPVCLHAETRAALPATIKTRMHPWLQSHPTALVGFAERARSLVPFVKEGVLFGLQHRHLTLEAGAVICPGAARIKGGILDGEVGEIVERARFLGKWFLYAASESTVFTIWGVMP